MNALGSDLGNVSSQVLIDNNSLDNVDWTSVYISSAIGGLMGALVQNGAQGDPLGIVQKSAGDKIPQSTATAINIIAAPLIDALIQTFRNDTK